MLYYLTALANLLTGPPTGHRLPGLRRLFDPADPGSRERGSLTLEQAIITAVLSAAGIALGIVIVGAVTSHSGNIK